MPSLLGHLSKPCTHAGGCGCQFGASCCLDCPLARCVLDEGIHLFTLVQRHRKIITAHQEGLDVEGLASSFGLTKRSIWRILADGNSS